MGGVDGDKIRNIAGRASGLGSLAGVGYPIVITRSATDGVFDAASGPGIGAVGTSTGTATNYLGLAIDASRRVPVGPANAPKRWALSRAPT